MRLFSFFLDSVLFFILDLWCPCLLNNISDISSLFRLEFSISQVGLSTDYLGASTSATKAHLGEKKLCLVFFITHPS